MRPGQRDLGLSSPDRSMPQSKQQRATRRPSFLSQWAVAGSCLDGSRSRWSIGFVATSFWSSPCFIIGEIRSSGFVVPGTDNDHCPTAAGIAYVKVTLRQPTAARPIPSIVISFKRLEDE